MIEQNVKNLLKEIPSKNPFNEKVTLVAAVKLQTAESINRAICAGVTDIGDNHVQEFRDKFSEICGNPKRHFIGHLQTNKIKYLIGKTDLYHSIDRLSVAEALSEKSRAAQITSNILLQINIGKEATKSGFYLEECEEVYQKISALPSLKIQGLMAMMPLDANQNLILDLGGKMREKFDLLKSCDKNFEYLSMGMSGDWKICIKAGSNLVRIGTAIFGERNYGK